MRDANGNLLPAGQVVTFSTNLGTLSAPSATTDGNGQAWVTLRGTDAGTATVTARATTATTGSTVVTLTSASPVIATFVIRGRTTDIAGPYNEGIVPVNGDSSVYEDILFNWSATGADRYEVVDAWGSVLYSGAGTGFQFYLNRMSNNTSVHFNSGNPNFNSTITLKAYKGSNVSTKTVSVLYSAYYCGSGCSN